MESAHDRATSHSSASTGSILDKKADDTKYEYELPPRAWWKVNVNIYILIAGIVLLWFIFGRGPRYYQVYNSPSTWGLVHVISAGLFGCICLVNVLHTPSHGKMYRTVHIALGRIAILASVVSLVAGGVVIFFEREAVTAGSIGLLIAAAVQALFHILGMYAMYKPTPSLSMHARSMHSLLLGACFSPAIQRLPDMLGVDFGESWPLYSWVFAIFLIFFSSYALQRRAFV